MGPFIKSFVKCVCLSFLLNVAYAFDDEFEKRWQQIHQEHVSHVEHLKGTSLSVPIEVTIGFSVMVVLMLTCFFIACICHRRHPEMFHTYYPSATVLPPQGGAYGSITVEPPVQAPAMLLPSQPAPRSRYAHSKDISTVPLCQDWLMVPRKAKLEPHVGNMGLVGK
ncbi:hypothetical protein HPB52_013860 [Rhipicephalus sanguineus]|uniref:Uncharacterized protein n=1 Tax=Rhipicephalus sanguineus TaxID=34632 RepID=A0A9D4SNY9_RHISA|nr:hypothetical protein HPB52_013860 [Rhipicephalus sanguineus]